jgi:hypothetical protein
MALVEQLGGRYQTVAAQKWLRHLFASDFQNIAFVDLADCDEPKLFLDAITALPCLETLVVGGENFTDDHLRRLHQISSLRGLVLDSTDVSAAALRKLKLRLPELQAFRSQRRAIAALGRFGHAQTGQSEAPQDLRAQVGNEYFDVAILFQGQFLPDAAAVDLRRVSTLQKLDLYGSILTGNGLRHVAGLSNLQELCLDGTNIDHGGLEHLQGLRNLRRLQLYRMPLTDDNLRFLTGLSKLEDLHFVGLLVTDQGLQHLRDLTNLKRLFLERVQVTDAGLKRLNGLTQLQELTLSYTEVTQRGVSELHKARPGCRIDIRGWWNGNYR